MLYYKNQLKLILSVIAVILCTMFPVNVKATGAFPNPVRVVQPDGSSLTIKIHGDEFFGYYTNEAGQLITKGTDGFFYFADYSTGKLKISNVRATSKSGITSGFQLGVPKYIIDQKRAEAIAEMNANMDRPIISKSSSAWMPATNQPKKVLVLLVEYQDIKFTVANPQQSFSNMMNQRGYSVNGASGSVADYYEQNSMGKYRPEFVVTQPLTLSKKRKEYGGIEDMSKKSFMQTREACRLADAAGVDFSQFDGDSDGRVDIVLIYYAGHNSAEGVEEAMWPHKHSLPITASDILVLDGKTIRNYAVTSELKGSSGTVICAPGTMIHEFGHCLGTYDIYDTSGQGTAAMWSRLSTWDGGNYNNGGNTPPHMTSFERYLLGWLTPEVLTAPGTYTLDKIDNNKAYMIKSPVTNEYFFLENRQFTNWDAYTNNGGSENPKGLLIIHHDLFSDNDAGFGFTSLLRYFTNNVNSNAAHQCVNLLEACGNEYRNQPISNVFFPGTLNKTEWTPLTYPSSRPWSNENTGVYVTNIRIEGEKVIFDYNVSAIDENKSQLSGVVRDHLKKVMPGVTVNLYPRASSRAVDPSTSSLFMLNLTNVTKALPIMSAETNLMGQYCFVNVPHGEYTIETDYSNYASYRGPLTLQVGSNISDIEIIPNTNNTFWDVVRWHGNTISGATGFTSGEPFYIKSIFDEADLKNYKKMYVNSVSIRSYKADQVEMSLVLGNTIVATQTVDSVVNGQDVLFDLSKLNIQRAEGQSLSVVAKFTGYNAPYAACYDLTTPNVANKGDLYSVEGNTWYTVGANFMVSVMFSDKLSSPYPYIYLENKSYSAGDTLILEVKNYDPKVREIKFSINKVATEANRYVLPSAGTYIIEAVLRQTDGSREVIRRKVNVK